jgi:hypothetical protein
MATMISPVRLTIPDDYNLRHEISPFDVPKNITATYLAETDEFEIKFRYISSENLRSFTNAAAKIHLGKISYRIYSLTLANASQKRSCIEYSILGVINNLMQTFSASVPERDRPLANYSTIKALVSHSSAALEKYLDECLRETQLHAIA